ncbi:MULTISPECIES: SemiSWEET family transporter [Vagococcus]|uniref:Uncharacterized protein n=1 Tax=Vagococcus teuberi TaxID=519472 RepID=A0A1J0A5D9_9ENTE|nr:MULTISPECIES: SemiSWEET family transporter [Vagococcus]APB31147.1 hypothetical protein BHY08_04465 [Vagococcus teuberi]RHH71299.1 hypothetical protein DW196_01825 [Vagococcus sp. AM17-17]
MGDNKSAKTNQSETTFIKYISWIATITAILMYVSYIPQISNNLAGDKGSPVQPLVAAINCSLWAIYGFKKTPRDWPIVLANFPGVIFGIITFLTAL